MNPEDNSSLTLKELSSIKYDNTDNNTTDAKINSSNVCLMHDTSDKFIARAMQNGDVILNDRNTLE